MMMMVMAQLYTPDNISKWREMSAYQMADKYCHYLSRGTRTPPPRRHLV